MARRASTAGFTLVEVMVVVFIIAIASSVIVLTLPDRGSALDREAGALEEVLQRLAEEAVLTGRAHALDVEPAGYRLLYRNGGNWIGLERGGRTVPGALDLTFLPPEDAQQLVGVAQPSAADGPEIVFDPIGVPPRGSLVLSQGLTDRVIALRPEIERVER